MNTRKADEVVSETDTVEEEGTEQDAQDYEENQRRKEKKEDALVVNQEKVNELEIRIRKWEEHYEIEEEYNRYLDELETKNPREEGVFPYHFTVILGTGARCTIPHHVVRFYKLEKGDIIDLAVWGIRKKVAFPKRKKFEEREEKVI